MKRLWLVCLLAGCAAPPTPSDTTLLAQIEILWDVQNKTSLSDSEQLLKLTPLSYNDLDHLLGGFRYLTATFKVENQSAQTLKNLTLRAYTANPSGTAVKELRGFPTAQDPQGPEILDSAVAQSIRPIHGTKLGNGPEPDPSASDFQAFAQSESQALADLARSKSLNLQVLDYGFVVSPRMLEPGASGFVNIAVRLPRRFEGLPNPYRFKLGLLVTTSSTFRVSQALGETQDQALARAKLLGHVQAVQLVLIGNNPPLQATGLEVIRLPNLRIGTAPTYLLE